MTEMEHPEMKRGSSKKDEKRLEEDWRRLEEDSRRQTKTRGKTKEKTTRLRKERTTNKEKSKISHELMVLGDFLWASY